MYQSIDAAIRFGNSNAINNLARQAKERDGESPHQWVKWLKLFMRGPLAEGV